MKKKIFKKRKDITDAEIYARLEEYKKYYAEDEEELKKERSLLLEEDYEL
jgi:hypothetical protein